MLLINRRASEPNANDVWSKVQIRCALAIEGTSNMVSLPQQQQTGREESDDIQHQLASLGIEMISETEV